jgi:hypothetical protein
MAKKKGKLGNERIRLLQSIGFEWDAQQASWNQRFNELKAHKASNGDFNVLRGQAENPQLGIWVLTQRQAKKKGQLSNERAHLLESIGFEWDAQKALWNQCINELKRCKALNGHSNVPRGYKQNPQLGKWADVQRTAKKKGKLSKEREIALNELGFHWSLGPGRRTDLQDSPRPTKRRCVAASAGSGQRGGRRST